MIYEEIVGSDKFIIRFLEVMDGFNGDVENDIIIVPLGGELVQ